MKISQDIEIRTTAGVKFDMFASETVEVVMGGFSLLDLSLRYANYTTSFKLPRTPTNEGILEFASETTRYNRPNVAVYVRFGTSDMSGYMKVVSFGTSYSVTLKFTEFINAMSGYELNEIVADIANPVFTVYGQENIASSICTSNKYTLFHSYSESSPILLKEMGVYINQGEIISMICRKAGYTAVFDAGVNLTTKFLFCRDWYYEIVQPTAGTYNVNIKKTTNNQYKSISELLKQLCLANGIYFTADEQKKEVTFQKIETVLASTPIDIETLTLQAKQHYTGHGRNNTIKYSVGDGIYSFTKYATFTADGATSKEVLQLEILIPSKVAGVHNLTDVTELVTASREGAKSDVWYSYQDGGGSVFNTEYLITPDLAPVYAFLQPVFADTFTITAKGYIGSLDISSIMQNRVIRSVTLGGIYFVDSLNYNINTGNSVLTLIKL